MQLLCNDLKAWDFAGMKEWSDAQAQAKNSRRRIHVGMICGICVEKIVELPEGKRSQKYKGRFVSQGNHARDEENIDGFRPRVRPGERGSSQDA